MISPPNGRSPLRAGTPPRLDRDREPADEPQRGKPSPSQRAQGGPLVSESPNAPQTTLLERTLLQGRRDTAWAGPEVNSRVVVVTAGRAVELIRYNPNRLRCRIAVVVGSPGSAAFGQQGVVFPSADTNAGDIQASAGEVMAAGQLPLDLGRHDAPARIWAIAAPTLTALVSVLEWFRAPETSP